MSLLAETVGGTTDEERERTADVYGARLSAKGFVRQVGIGHGDWQLSSIRAPIGG